MDRVLLSHGAGGREMGELIRRVFLAAYGSEASQPDDSAVLRLDVPDIAFTTDSFVVSPLFFPGGDIGRLAVAGTVNDLLTAGARPLALSAS
ncbi:MAG: AIR synthase related protein, partial [Thermodesulfobacteriota bacterium]